MIAYATRSTKCGLYYSLLSVTCLAVCFEIIQVVLLATGRKHACYNESDVQGDEKPLLWRHGLSTGFGVLAIACLAVTLKKQGSADGARTPLLEKTATATLGNTEI